MPSVLLFISYLIWMIFVVSMILCGTSWLVALQAVRQGDTKLMLAAFNGWFALYHLVCGTSICFLLVFG